MSTTANIGGATITDGDWLGNPIPIPIRGSASSMGTYGGFGGTATSTSTDPSVSTNSTMERAFLVPRNGTLKFFHVRIANAVASDALTATIRVNGVDSTIVANLVGASDYKTDLTHSISVNAGDLVCVHTTQGGTSFSAVWNYEIWLY